METGKLARKETQIIEAYFNYWQEHIKTIEDKQRVVQFEHIMSHVAEELYGPTLPSNWLSVSFWTIRSRCRRRRIGEVTPACALTAMPEKGSTGFETIEQSTAFPDHINRPGNERSIHAACQLQITKPLTTPTSPPSSPAAMP